MRSKVFAVLKGYVSSTLAAVLLAAGCATGAGVDGGRRYGLTFHDAQEAVRRGEGRQALAYYERKAEELEREGDLLDAAASHYALAVTSSYLGAYQKGIRSALRALELLEKTPKSQAMLERQANIYITLGILYRRADPAEALRYYRQGLELAKAFPYRGQIMHWESIFMRHLGNVAYAQADYPAALRYGLESVRLQEEFLARGANYSVLRNARLHLAWAYTLVGNANRRLRNFGEADVAVRHALGIASFCRETHKVLNCP